MHKNKIEKQINRFIIRGTVQITSTYAHDVHSIL